MSPYFKNLRAKIGHELLLVPGVAAVIHNHRGELLLQEKFDGTWSLPAGAVEPGESPEDAIRREVIEETGLMVEPVGIQGIFGGPDFRHLYPNGDLVEYTIVLFRCRVVEESAKDIDPETKSLRYFSEERMPDLQLPYPKTALFGIRAVLRTAVQRDAPNIVRVLRASRLRFLPYAPPAHSEAEDLQWAKHRLIPSAGVTAACVDGNIVGVLAVRHAPDADWIDQLYVQPEYCGRGIGTQLSGFALSSLQRPIRLYTFQQNVCAQAFYEAFGFRAIAYGDGSQNEERCPDILYELADGSETRLNETRHGGP